MARQIKPITNLERRFAELLSQGYSACDSARKAFGWTCARFTREEQKAKILAASKRIKDEVAKLKQTDLEEAVLQNMVEGSNPSDWESLHQYAFRRLKTIRDNTRNAANVRYEAMLALEKLSDPAQDINLIWKYIDSVWEGLTAHCPCCHKDFALSEVTNAKLSDYRKVQEIETSPILQETIDRRLYLLGKAEKRRKPHKSQMISLAAPERNIVALGLARGGKSFNLAMIALLHLLIPGSNVWLLARVYDDAKYEFEYLQHFLFTMFYPVEKHMYSITFDKKTGDASIITRWNSEITIKSGKSKGSITGQELDAMLVAEPGWVDGELFEEVRARMSSRLGRIFAFGTPKGTGGFLGRLLKMSQRDMSTGRKLELGARLIKNGADWGKSLLVYNFDAVDNPEYVMSEIEAAKSELTESEFASEFQGKMVSDSNSKFPFIKPHHARIIRKDELGKVSAVLGVDQGERNFAAVLLGWNGDKVFVFDEYFDRSDDTIKSNLIKLNSATYNKVITIGLPPERWKLTIFDADPPIWGQLKELEDEGRKWKTDHTFRPKNQKEFTNWRQETCDWINQLAKDNRIVFSPTCDQLQDQLMEALKEPEDPTREGRSINRKGWVVNDPWRGDHCLDAFLLACWTIFQNQILIDVADLKTGNVYDYLEQQFQYNMKKNEEAEMKGFKPSVSDSEIYEDVFGRKETKMPNIFQTRKMWYPDA